MEIIKHGNPLGKQFGFVCDNCGAEFIADIKECVFLKVFKNTDFSENVCMCKCPDCEKYVSFDKTKCK